MDKIKAGARRTRFLEIEQLTETGCIFANGEVFDGLLGPMAIRSLQGSVRQGFRAMGEALKATVEGSWRPAL